MTTLTREQRREMKRRWHAWRKAYPEKKPAVMDMIEKGYTLDAIMETLGGSIPTTATASSSPPSQSSKDFDAKAAWKRQTDRINARTARFRS
jgi:hypothetical protein